MVSLRELPRPGAVRVGRPCSRCLVASEPDEFARQGGGVAGRRVVGGGLAAYLAVSLKVGRDDRQSDDRPKRPSSNPPRTADWR